MEKEILIIIEGALAISGWSKFILERKKGNEDKRKEILEKFLLKLQFKTEENKKRFDDLTADLKGKVDSLDYFPSRLKDTFDNLPDEDMRKIFWRVTIQQMQENNSSAITLIDNYVPNSQLSLSFINFCKDFVIHAKDWKAKWEYVEGLKNISPNFNSELMSETFPKDFDKGLQNEIEYFKEKSRTKYRR